MENVLVSQLFKVGSKDATLRSIDPSDSTTLDYMLASFSDKNGICKECGQNNSSIPKFKAVPPDSKNAISKLKQQKTYKALSHLTLNNKTSVTVKQ